MSGKLISIILPVYNNEETLKRCLDSIVGQKFEDFELIVINNGSTDTSAVLCDSYAEKDSRLWVVHIVHDETAAAWNKGLELATGRYLFFMEPADYIENGIFEKIAGQLLRDFDVIFLKATEIRPDDSVRPIPSFDKLAGLSHDEVLQIFSRRLPDRVWDKFIRSEILAKNSIWFATGGMWEDADFCMTLYLHAKIYGVLSGINCYCRRPVQDTRQHQEWCERIILTLSKWTRDADLLYPEHVAVIHHWMAAIYCDELMPRYGQLPREEQKEFKAGIHDFQWLLDIRNNRSDQFTKKLYNKLGPWATSRLMSKTRKPRTEGK